MEEDALNSGLEEWDLLPEFQKEMIIKGLEQAEAGLGTSISEVTKRVREKYGLVQKSS